jgi:hypothetical protein
MNDMNVERATLIEMPYFIAFDAVECRKTSCRQEKINGSRKAAATLKSLRQSLFGDLFCSGIGLSEKTAFWVGEQVVMIDQCLNLIRLLIVHASMYKLFTSIFALSFLLNFETNHST